MENIERIIKLREDAIHKLVEEKEQIESELKELNTREVEINKQLAKLGYDIKRKPSSTGVRWPRGMMEDGLYRGKYKGRAYYLRVNDGKGRVDDIEGEFSSLSRAACAVKKAVTGREIASRGPTFWEKMG